MAHETHALKIEWMDLRETRQFIDCIEHIFKCPRPASSCFPHLAILNIPDGDAPLCKRFAKRFYIGEPAGPASAVYQHDDGKRALAGWNAKCTALAVCLPVKHRN
jgi:hypothetical protein